ncbi:alpha/beta hydrolase [Solitalea sp. MAHUQ-68]|uniref:Alpha/beta hydrolase n=1 Tax=Solitalea agri TaxID=2953739 RepID=A0A9X2F3L8_9SPHI|nr:alpha/beta hydrolase [Solitalea agri]MCO4294137.1 alpha/beta hydrolase [Solitalea agri]
MNVYFISGLGADKRVFSNLSFPAHFQIKHINWIEPLERESIADYAKRLSSQIDQNQPFNLVGLSFGGIILTELLKIINPQKAVLISSIKTHTELPLLLRFAGKLRLHKIIPTPMLKSANWFSFKLFGLQSLEERQLFKDILSDTSTNFMRWAIDKVLTWQHESPSKDIIHIHGTSDLILPYQSASADFTIKKGGHFMVFNKHEEITTILTEILTNNS